MDRVKKRTRGTEIPAAADAIDDQDADELTPQSLLREELAEPADQTLSVVDESEIGEGRGRDEAELAQEQPAGRRPAHRDPAASDRGPGRVHSRNAGKRQSQG